MHEVDTRSTDDNYCHDDNDEDECSLNPIAEGKRVSKSSG